MLIANTGQSLVIMNLRTGEQVQLPPGQMTPVLDSKIPFIDDSFVLISLFNAGVLVAYTDAGAAYPGFPTTANPADSKRIPPVDADYAAAVVGAASLRCYGAQTALCGDSIIADWRYAPDASTSETRGRGLISYAKSLCGQRVSIIYNGAVGGAYVTDAGSVMPVSRQVDIAIQTAADEVIVQGGVNDILNGVPLEAVQAAHLISYQKVVQSGKRCRALTNPPIGTGYGGYTVARQAQILALNAWIRQLHRTGVLGNRFFASDTYAGAVDPAGDYYATWDGLHPRNSTAYRMGKILAADWSAAYPPRPLLVASNNDNYGFDPSLKNILDNGLFVTGSGTATGFTASVSGATHTPSLVAHPAGFGNYQRLVATSSATGQHSRLSTADLKARVTVGKSYIALCEVTASSITNMRGVRLNMTANGPGGNVSVSDFQLDSTNDVALPEGFSQVLMTPVLQTYPGQGALTSFSANVTQFFSGAGGGTLDIGRFSIIQID